MADLPVSTVARIAKRAGVERVGKDATAALIVYAEAYIGDLAKEAARLASHAGRKTIQADDIEIAAKKPLKDVLKGAPQAPAAKQ